MTDIADSRRLTSMLDGHITTQLIASAVRFQIPDLLTESVAEDQPSAATGIDPARLRRFLSALRQPGLVETVGEGTYRNSPMARHLREETGADNDGGRRMRRREGQREGRTERRA